MADPATGGAVGLLFAELYLIANKLIKNYIEFEPRLGDLAKTLAALNPLIKNISVQNRSLHLPNQVTENLKKDIEEGLKLVRKYSEAGAVTGCLKMITIYTTQIRKLEESLRKQLDILKTHEVWVTNESYSLLTRVAEKMEIIPKDWQPNYRNDLIEARDEELGRPGKEVEKVKLHMKKGIKRMKKRRLVRQAPLTWHIYEKYKYASRLLGLGGDRGRQLDILKVQDTEDVEKNLIAEHSIEKSVEKALNEFRRESFHVVEGIKRIESRGVMENEGECLWKVPELPLFTVGLDVPLKELKMKLLKDDQVSKLVVTAAGGCGKTTLAAKFCQDEEVKGKFKNNIFFVIVSRAPYLDSIVRELYQRRGSSVPTFQDEETAVKSLQNFLKDEGQNPLLLVLDDVWSGSESLLDKFELTMPNYKILVTSRSEFPRFGSSYHLQSLDFDNAMKLFHHSASLGDKSSHIPPEISRQIVKGCKGVPLAIRVAGRSLCGQPIEIWQQRLIRRSKGSSILDNETQLLRRLQSSLDASTKETAMNKECFLDLGSFPEGQRIHVTALIDMWAEAYDLLDEDILCVGNLHKLTNQSLANLVVPRKDDMEGDGYYSEYFVTQHDLLRELAIFETRVTRQQDPGHRERLIINISGDYVPKWLRENKYQSMKARLVSISTDGVFSAKWHNVELPEAEVLVLNFQSKNYGLPEFVEKMDNLKVLVVTNYGSLRAELRNFQLLCSLSNLKRIRLERISIPSIMEKPIELKSLQKISLFMCNIGQAFSNGSIQISYVFPHLMEMNIDCCEDLVEMPADLCDLIHLRKLSITNSPKLLALPEEIGKLVNLELLRLRSCMNLVKLPGSTKDLKKVNFLDISYCISVKELPEEIGEMSALRRLSMIECSGLQKLPRSVLDLEQLMEVICDDKRKYLWEAFLPSLRNTQVVVVKENLNLNVQGTRKVKENLYSFTEEVGTSEVKERSDSSTEELVSRIEAQFGIQNQSEAEAGCELPELPQPIVELDVPLEELQREIVKDDCCSDDAEFAALPNNEVLVPMQIASSLKIPTLRTVFPLHLFQPENKKRLAHKSHVSSSYEPTLPPEHNSSTDHSRHMSSANSTISIELCQEDSSSIVDGQVRTHILPIDLERYEKENSSHLSRVGMQDMYLAMQRFHVMSTRLVQSEERVAVLETNYKKGEESWKLEHRKLSEQHNSAMAQVASLTKEKDSLAERIELLEQNYVTGRQEAQEILTNEWKPEFRRQMQDAEKECFELGCRVGFKSFLAKVENKFPNLDLSDISHFEPIGFDLKVIEELLGPDHDNETDNSDEEVGNDEERGGKSVAAEVPEHVLELLYHYADDDMIDGTTIILNMEEEVFGVAKPMYILREDVMQFMKMTPISATCINVYMRHLYDVLKQSNIDGMVRFCDAASISVGKPDEKSQVLATRLQQLSTNQILLVPYNSGNHWILTIVNEEKDKCYFMDPIHSLGDTFEWQLIVNNGIKQWNHQTGRGLDKSPVWKILKGPKQPSTVECGYYVMRYMKEMVENITLSFEKKWDSKKYFSAYKETERAYTKREIDEVQWEWASLVYQQKRRGLRMAGSG